MNQSTDPSVPRQRLVLYPRQLRLRYHILIHSLYRRTIRIANTGHHPYYAYLENRLHNGLVRECDDVCDGIINTANTPVPANLYFVNAGVTLNPATSLVVTGSQALMELSEWLMGARMHEAGLEVRERVQDMLFGRALFWEWREDDGRRMGRVRPL